MGLERNERWRTSVAVVIGVIAVAAEIALAVVWQRPLGFLVALIVTVVTVVRVQRRRSRRSHV